MGRPRAEAVESGDGVDEPVEADAPIEPDRVLGDRAGEQADSVRTSRRQPEAAEVGAGERGSGKRVSQSEGLEAGHRRPEPLHQPSGNGVRMGEGHLLADDRANAGLERVPGTRRAKAGPGLEQRPDGRVPAEMARGLVQVEVEARDPASAVHHVHGSSNAGDGLAP